MGVRVCEGGVVVWGDCAVGVLSHMGVEGVMRGEGGVVVCRGVARDWVFDAVLMGGRGVVVTARNEVVEFVVGDGGVVFGRGGGGGEDGFV